MFLIVTFFLIISFLTQLSVISDELKWEIDAVHWKKHARCGIGSSIANSWRVLAQVRLMVFPMLGIGWRVSLSRNENKEEIVVMSSDCLTLVFTLEKCRWQLNFFSLCQYRTYIKVQYFNTFSENLQNTLVYKYFINKSYQLSIVIVTLFSSLRSLPKLTELLAIKIITWLWLKSEFSDQCLQTYILMYFIVLKTLSAIEY